VLLHSPFIKRLLSRLKPSVVLTVTIFVLIFHLAELRFIDRPLDNYFSTAILSLLVFVLFLNLQISDNNPVAKCGKKYSLGIYITHPVVQHLNELGTFNGSVMMHLTHIVVFAITLAIVICYYKLKSNLKKLLPKRSAP
jgi:surface polysaccharide O-acyltransferase-like enzyme